MQQEFYPPTTDVIKPSGDLIKIGERELVLFDRAKYEAGLLTLRLFQPGSINNEQLIKQLIETGVIKEKKEAHSLIGKFLFPAMGLVLDELCVLPIILIHKPRSFYASEYKSGSNDKPDCASWDGIAPNDNIVGPRSHVCMEQDSNGRWVEVCEDAKWVDGKRPKCNRHVVVGLFETTYGIPFKYTFVGKGISAWNAYMRKYQKRIETARATEALRKVMPNIKLSDVKTSPDEVIMFRTNNEGTYVSLDITTETLPGLDINQMAPLLKHYRETLFTASNYSGNDEVKGDASEYVEGVAPAAESDNIKSPPAKEAAEVTSEGFTL